MKGKFKILVAESSPLYRKTYNRVFQELDIIDDIEFAADGMEAAEIAERFHPTFLVSELILPGLDGFELLHCVGDNAIKIISTFVLQEDLLFAAFREGAHHIFIKPLSAEVIKNNVLRLIHSPLKRHIPFKHPASIEQQIYTMLVRTGIPVHIQGFKMLRYGIRLVVDNPSLVDHMTKRLYCDIAENFDTTWNCVERNIRTAIETAYDRGNFAYLNELFGYTIDSNRGKPTNSEFIAMVADHIRLQTYHS